MASTPQQIYDSLDVDELRQTYGPNIQGIGIGKRRRDGQATEEPCIVVYVHEKLPRAELALRGRQDEILPQEIDGVPIDVEEGRTWEAGRHGPRLSSLPSAGDLGLRAAGLSLRSRLRRMQADQIPIDPGQLLELLELLCGDREPPLTTRHRPIQPGYSCGHPNVTAGTIGVLVSYEGKPALLSNNHVIADTNRASIGDPVWQPGRHDGGGADDSIGPLAAFDPIAFGSQGPNTIEDSAIAQLAVQHLQEIPRGVGAPAGVVPTDILAPEQPAKKVGRTTGLTNGTIRTYPTKGRVQYGDGKVAQYEDLVAYTDISDPGDSGSGIMDGQNRYQSLLFAGSDLVTLGQVMAHIFDRWDLELLPAA